MILWQLERRNGGGPITLCEDHALMATNVAFRMAGLQPAPTMTQAALVFDLVRHMNGDHGNPMTSTELGDCEACQDEKEQQRKETA